MEANKTGHSLPFISFASQKSSQTGIAQVKGKDSTVSKRAISLLFLPFLRQGLMQLRLTSDLFCSQGW